MLKLISPLLLFFAPACLARFSPFVPFDSWLRRWSKLIAHPDQRCLNVDGECLYWPTSRCAGGWEEKHNGIRTLPFCHGGGHRRCCFPCDTQCMANEQLWSREDIACNNTRGRCQNTTNFCNGVYATGMCGGPFDRQCCDPKISPGGICPLVTYEPTDHLIAVGDEEMRVHPDFLPTMNVINKAAGDCGVKVLVGFTFRKPRKSKSDVMRSFVYKYYSNYFVGHAVGIFLNTTRGFCPHWCSYNGYWPDTKCFSDSLIAAGLNRETNFYLDVHDGFNRNVTAWRKLSREIRDVC
ncbi:uncharacterized protein LOC143458052 [Clavelina lepadiformis]|uniref:uncharacterized protein LOC143458052 n=1 Tax=Clavelina lepadiformis TaxID=159417 RepID=UPI0040415662